MSCKTPQNILVSACLLGFCTRYDGNIKENPEIHNLLKNNICIPICPEQLGGLPTPRPAADIHGGDGYDVLEGKAQVLTKEGDDVTKAFIKGAEEVLKAARLCKANMAILKSGSPSCATTNITGVTAALLKKNDISVDEL